MGEVARLFADAGVVALVPVISPYRADRDRARAIHEAARPAVRGGVRRHAARGVRGPRPQGPLRQGPGRRDPGFTGIDDPYEAPEHPDLRLTPADGDPAAQAARVLALLAG